MTDSIHSPLSPLTYYPCDNPDSTLRFVLLHGWGTNSASWKNLREHLLPLGHVYTLDLPGFGDNTLAFELTPNAVLAWLAEVLPEGAVLVGWSLGGMLATEYAHRYPERCRALITIASNLKFARCDTWPHACDAETFATFLTQFKDDAPSVFQRFKALQAMGDKQRKHVLSVLNAAQQVPSEHLQAQWHHSLQLLDQLDARSYAPDICLPWLGIFGEKDTLVPASVVEDFPEPCVTHLIDGAGHAPHISCAEMLADRIQHFLSEQHIYSATPARHIKDVQSSFNSAADTYDQQAEVQRVILAKLLKLFEPNHGKNYSTEESAQNLFVDVGCGSGEGLVQLQQRYNDSITLVGVDFAPAMLAQARQKLNADIPLLCANMDSLPFPNNSVSTFFASLSLQWTNSYTQLFEQFHRQLAVGGQVVFATLGAHTLNELTHAWRAADGHVHTNSFVHHSELDALLMRAGFTIEQKHIALERIYFPTLTALMRSIKGIGARNVNQQQTKGLTTQRRLHKVAEAYERFRTEQGLPATYDVYYYVVKPSQGRL